MFRNPFSSTPLDTKCEIISDVFIKYYSYGDDWENFWINNDIAPQLAFAVRHGLANLTMDGETIIQETWDDLCDNILDVDSEKFYKNMDDLFGSSEWAFWEEDNE